MKDADVALETAENIKKALREDRGLDEGEEDFSVETAEQSIATIGTILSIINLVVAGIAAISLIVGGVGIMNTMYTSVLERTREIGIMKAVGARNKDVMYLFLFESGMLGLAGGLIGAVLGLGFAFFVSTVASVAVPSIGFGVSFSPNLFFFSIFFALGIGTLSGILPALQASRLEPVEALRK